MSSWERVPDTQSEWANIFLVKKYSKGVNREYFIYCSYVEIA